MERFYKIMGKSIKSWEKDIRGGYVPTELYDTVQEIMSRKPH